MGRVRTTVRTGAAAGAAALAVAAGPANPGYDPAPVSAVGVRWGAEDADCAPAGVYYVKVTRTAATGSDQSPWPLELRVQREPGRRAGGPTAAPSAWPSGAPVLPGTEAVSRTGGTGFNDARALGPGVWRDELRPGQTRSYRVPLTLRTDIGGTAVGGPAYAEGLAAGAAGRGASGGGRWKLPVSEGPYASTGTA